MENVTPVGASAADNRSADRTFRLVELVGEADVTSSHLWELLEAEVARKPPLLVLDLSRLTFLDSWALHKILAAGQRLRRDGSSLVLAAPTGEVRRILELIGADRLVAVCASVAEAVAAAP
jgi:anti-sigma B factor antagonist